MTFRIPIDGLIDDIGAEEEPIVIERSGTPTVDALGQTSRSVTQLEATALVHQATRAQLERVAVDYGPDYRAFYTRTPLQAPKTATGTPTDVVVYAGQRWTIVAAADYSDLAGLFLALGSLQA